MEYQMCSRCVMDSTDPDIIFDANGYCNHCTEALVNLKTHYMPDERGKKKLEEIIKQIKEDGKENKYDCIIGLSGGVDSSYLAYKAKDFGLRALCFHVDGGWDTEIAKNNIKNIVEKLGYDLFTYTVDWEEMRDLQRAYFESALANQDVPQDHVFFAVLLKKAEEMNIKYFLSGSNWVSESILPKNMEYDAMDARQLKAIHKRFGSIPLNTYKTLGLLEYCKFYYFKNAPFVSCVKTVSPLNLMPYNTNEARAEMAREIGWQNYGRKHGESSFTKFFQNYYLPEKFGFDKRKAHLSSLICAGELSRDEALKKLEEPLYDTDELAKDKDFILQRLGYTEEDWERLMKLPNKIATDYPNIYIYIYIARKLNGLLRKLGLMKD